MRLFLRSCGLLSLLLAFGAAPAGAVPAFPSALTVHVDGVGTDVIDSDVLGCGPPSGYTYTCTGTYAASPGGYGYAIQNWNLTLDQDPSIGGVFGFVNNSGVTQIFTMTFQIPVLVFGPASLIGGSIGGSTTDNGDGLGGVATVAPDPIYTGLIDGLPVAGATLLLDPFSTTYPFAFATTIFGGCPPTCFGLPGVTAPGPAVTATIGIQHKFSLTAGDSIAVTSNFIVNPVPEPSTALLLGIGLGGFAIARRRV